MARRFEIWQSALVVWFILLIFRYELMFDILLRLPETAGTGLMAELIIYLSLPFIILFCRRKYYFIKEPVKFYNLTGLFFLFMFLFSGIISGENPDFQKDLSVTKLLRPFSTVNVLHIKGGNKGEQKNLIVKNANRESIIYIDSIHFQKSWVYFQKQKPFEIPESKIQYKDGKPLVTKKTFILGSDILGRDVFSRLVFGVRTSLSIGICASLISFLIGVIAGFIAGYYEGFADILLSRAVDVLLSFPVIILIILIVALFGSSLPALILTLGFTGWMGLFKIVKSELILLKTKDYFITSKFIGLSNTQLIIKDALPVFIVPALTNLIFQINNVIIAESSLSYLGLGVGDVYPSWGAMIQSGQEYISSAWWLMFFPGLLIILTLQSVRGFGDKINSYFNPGLINDK